MFRKVLILAACVLVLPACELQAGVVNSKWIAGPKDYWEDAAAWKPAIVPDNTPSQTFAVTIDSNEVGLEEVTVFLRMHRTIDQLQCYGQVNLDLWATHWAQLTLIGPNGLTNYGELKIHGRDGLEILADIINTPGAYLSLHSLTIMGNLTNQAGAIMDVDKGEARLARGELENEGTILVVPMCSLLVHDQLHNRGKINIYGGECSADHGLDNSSIGVIAGFGVLYAGAPLANSGTIYATGGTLTVITDGPMSNSGTIGNSALASLNVMHIGPPEDANNSGTIEVNADGGVAFDCNLVNESGAAIKLLGGTLATKKVAQSPGATLEGFGGITGNIVIDPNGIMKLTGPTNIVGDVTISQNATLEISDGTTLVTGQTTCNGTIHMKGGRIIPQGGLSGNCNIIWEPGTYTNIADFNLDGQVNFEDFTDFADTWLWQADWHAP